MNIFHIKALFFVLFFILMLLPSIFYFSNILLVQDSFSRCEVFCCRHEAVWC